MDLTIPFGDTTLNVRVAVLVKRGDGLVFEKSKKGYYFPVGGRVKVGENSEEAAKREVFEELGVVIDNLEQRGVVELFFARDGSPVQEICFVYSASVADDLELTEDFTVFTLEEIDNIDFRPKIIKEVMKARSGTILHLIEN